MIKSQQRTSPANHAPHKSLPKIQWFPQVTVELSYWHGNQKLKSLDQFEWHGDAVMGPALEDARNKCELFKIDASSSLELWAFRSLWHVAKFRERDQHWSFVDGRDHGRTRLLLSHHPVWSSKHGLMTKPETWPQFSATFQKVISVDASLSDGEALRRHVNVAVIIVDQGAKLQAMAITDGQVRDLAVRRQGPNDRSPGTDLIMVSGSITVSMPPYLEAAGQLPFIAAVRGSLAVDVTLDKQCTAKSRLDNTQRTTLWGLKAITDTDRFN